ncbi:MAG: hydroxymethylglutaryl-CoA lyase [Zetaproteobacteria bacterium]|nr:hydroxymethylglutaryl-CoA lyase [Pseudobdellovibrionaceae bacterium]
MALIPCGIVLSGSSSGFLCLWMLKLVQEIAEKRNVMVLSPQKMTEDVRLIEVGMRDGLQSEKVTLTLDQKKKFIDGLVAAGLTEIQVGSFVHPRRVPQMADTDALFQALGRSEGVTYSALVLNARGLERAIACGVEQVDLSISTSETHSKKNTGMGLVTAKAMMKDMITEARMAGLKVRLGFQCVFGCQYEGQRQIHHLMTMLEGLVDTQLDSISFADSAGMAWPEQIKQFMVPVFSLVGSLPVVLHLHDTRGLAMANLMAGIESGVTLFDTGIGGLGGCPFIPGAAGNLATEDVVSLLDCMSVNSGIDLSSLCLLSAEMESVLGRSLPGRLYQLSGKGMLGGQKIQSSNIQL